MDKISLLENNDNFTFLYNYYNDSNKFLKNFIGKNELKHSDILQWVFDPESNHKLKFMPIRNLLINYGYDLSNKFIKNVSIIREYHNIDLFIRIRLDDKYMNIIIENKVNASLSNDQLMNYKDFIEFKYPNDELLCLYLHPNYNDESEKAKNDGYESITYQDLYDFVLSKMLEQVYDVDARLILNNYINCLSFPSFNDEFIIITKNESNCLKKLFEESDVMRDIISNIKNDDDEKVKKYYYDNKIFFIFLFKKYLKLTEKNEEITKDLTDILKKKYYIFNSPSGPQSFSSIKDVLEAMFDFLLKKYSISEIDDLINLYDNPLLVNVDDITNVNHSNYYLTYNKKIEKDGKFYYILSNWYVWEYYDLRDKINELKKENSIYDDITLY